jgi:SRSO17 transposase
MFPAGRSARAGLALPLFAVVPRAVEGFRDAWGAFQSAFHACLSRSEPRAPCFDSMVGPWSPLERQSIAPMALQVEGGTVRGLQRFSSAGRWDAEQRRWKEHQLVAAALGEPDGILRCDATGVVTKGTDSVGLARQSGGSLGKVAHWQVGGWAGSASRQGYALVDQRLLLPEVWFTEADAARRAQCKVPPALTFQSQPQLAAMMLQAIVRAGRLPCKYVVAACLSGNSPDFLDAVDACVGVTRLVASPADTRCWLQRPPTEDKTSIYTGEVRAKRGAVAPPSAPRAVAAVATSLPASSW